MIGNSRPGAPLPYGTAAREQVVSEVGDFANADGCRISLIGDNVIFQARFDGAEVTFGIDVTQLLEALQQYGKLYGN